MSVIVLALLAAQAVTPTAAPARAAASAKDKVRCVRIAETGSLARATKVCKTVGEWDEQRRNADRQARDMQNPASQQGTGPTG